MADPMQQFLDGHLMRGECAFDIGANQGHYTRCMLERVGPKGTVDAFEPNPEMAAVLRSAVAAPNVKVHQCAVSEAITPHKEFFVDRREGMQAVASSFNRLDGLDGLTQPIQVETITIDHFCALHGVKPKLIKIDVEGHELEVLRGAVDTIDRFRPIIAFEFWETWWDKSVRRIFDYLRMHYQLIRVQDGALVNDYYYTHRGTETVDIGCVPVEAMRGEPIDPQILMSNDGSSHEEIAASGV